MKSTLVIALGILMVGVALVVPSAIAQEGGTGGLPAGQPITLGSIENAISVLTDFLIYVAGTVAVFFVVLSGILWTTSGGDPGRLKSAQNMFKAAIIGSIIIFGVGVILNTVENCLQGGCFSGDSRPTPTGTPAKKASGDSCVLDSQCASGFCASVPGKVSSQCR